MKIISSAPTRISLFGGSTDIPSFYKEHEGYVISLAINLRQHFAFYTGDDMFEINKDEFPYNGKKEFIYKMFTDAKIGHLIKIISTCDAYLGSGLGTSAAAAVSTLAAIDRIKGKDTRIQDLVKRAYKAEEKMGWYGGMQDQWASSLGGANILHFNKDGSTGIIAAQRGIIEYLRQGMVLIWTGERKNKHHLQDGFKKLDKDQTKHLLAIKKLALDATDYFLRGNIVRLGELLHTSWRLKKKSNPLISNQKIDKIYEQAMESGALGGKLLGAGGGGYMLFMVEPQDRQDFIKRMKTKEVDFSIDWQGVETRII